MNRARSLFRCFPSRLWVNRVRGDERVYHLEQLCLHWGRDMAWHRGQPSGRVAFGEDSPQGPTWLWGLQQQQPPRTGDGNLSQYPCCHLGQEECGTWSLGCRWASQPAPLAAVRLADRVLYLRGKPSCLPVPFFPQVAPLLSPLPSLSAAGWAQGAAFSPWGKPSLSHTTGKTACETEAVGSLELKLTFLLKSIPFGKQFPAFLSGISEGIERDPCSRGIKPFKGALSNKAKIREHRSDVFPIKAFSFLSSFFFPCCGCLSLCWAGLH